MMTRIAVIYTYQEITAKNGEDLAIHPSKGKKARVKMR